MKILFTSIGRRVELIQAFKLASENLDINLEIHGSDISQSAPALMFCDKTVITPRIKDNKYIPFLQEYCSKNDIDALIPTIDTDLMLLSQNKKNFGKTKVIISAEDKVMLCRDKRYTADYFNSLGLESPYPIDEWTKYNGGYPAFIKPKDGSSSISAFKVENEKELELFAEQVPDYIIQPYISGTEYTVDIFCDFDGNPIFITPRIRLAVRAGEVLKTEIVQDHIIIEEIKRLIADYKPCGQITVQLIRQNITEKNYYIEINPRFGGGAPLSIKAGADSAKALLELLNGKKLEYVSLAAEDGAVFSRFDQSIKVN